MVQSTQLTGGSTADESSLGLQKGPAANMCTPTSTQNMNMDWMGTSEPSTFNQERTIARAPPKWSTAKPENLNRTANFYGS